MKIPYLRNMNSRKPRRDDDKRSGGRPRISSPKTSSSYSKRDSNAAPKKFSSSDFKDTPQRRNNADSGNDFPKKRSYTKRTEGPVNQPFNRKPYGENNNADKRSFAKRSEGGNDKPFVRKPYGDRDNTEKRPYTKRSEGSNDQSFVRKPYGDRDNTEKRPYTKRSEGGNDQSFVRKPYGDRDNTEKRPYTKRSEGSNDQSFVRKPYGDRDNTEKRPYTKRNEGSNDQSFVRKPYGDRDNTEKRPYTKRNEGGNDQPFVRKPYGDRDNTEKRPYTKRSEGGNDQPFVRKPYGDKDNTEKRSYKRRPEAEDQESKPARREAVSFGKPYVKKPYVDKESKPFTSRDDSSSTRSTGKKREAVGDKNPDFIRLNRYLSNAGICSRREADDLIASGVVTVNGELVTELGAKVHRDNDEVRYNNEPVRKEKLQYIVMNKPKDFITTTDDPQERKMVTTLVERLTSARVYPVGRLDRNTTGVLLLTNDGDLTLKLTHPKFGVTKVYAVELDTKLRQEDYVKIKAGLVLEDGPIQVDDVAYIEDMDKNHVGVQLHSGRNRIVRRIFESLGYKVVKLDRTSFASLSKKGLKRGECRFLTPAEVGRLKNLKS